MMVLLRMDVSVRCCSPDSQFKCHIYIAVPKISWHRVEIQAKDFWIFVFVWLFVCCRTLKFLSLLSGISRGLWGERTTWARWRASMLHPHSPLSPHSPLVFTAAFWQRLWLNHLSVQQFASVFLLCLTLFWTSVTTVFNFMSCLQLL